MADSFQFRTEDAKAIVYTLEDVLISSYNTGGANYGLDKDRFTTEAAEDHIALLLPAVQQAREAARRETDGDVAPDESFGLVFEEITWTY